MKKFLSIIVIFFSLALSAQAPTLNQYGTRTPKLEVYPTTAKSIDVNAGLSVNSTTSGFVPPRMTTTQKLAISSPSVGTLVYDTTLGKYNMFNGTSWIDISSGTSTLYGLQETTDVNYSTTNPLISEDVVEGRSVWSTDLTNSVGLIPDDLSVEFNSPSGTGKLTSSATGSVNWVLPNQSGTVALQENLGVQITEITAEGPIVVNNPDTPTPQITIDQATSTSGGYLSVSDWNTFNGKQDNISTGTTSQYYRGDKTWQTLNSTAVGLGSVPNVDATNPANISQTSSYRFTTDTEKSTWNNSVKFIAKNTSNPSFTGTTTETILDSYLVPANTLSSVSSLQMYFRYRKTGTAGTSAMRVYINTSNSLSGATMIAYNTTAASNLWILMERTFSLYGGSLYGWPFTSSAISDVTGLGISLSSTSLNPAGNFYIILTGQLGNSADTMILDLFKATN